MIRILTALFLFMTFVVKGEEHAYPLPASIMGRQNTNVTVSPNGDVVLSFVTPLKSGYRIGIAISTDEGSSWRVTDSIAFMRASMIGLQRRPTVFKNGDGSLVCSYEDQKVGDAMPRVYVTRSDAGSFTWTTPVAVVRGFQASMQDFSSMASMGNGRLAIAFISSDVKSSGRHVYVVTSSDYGLTWSDPVRANTSSWMGNACECCMTSVSYSPLGTLGVAFRANRNNIRDIHVAFSMNDGVSFDEPVLIQDGIWTISGCPSTGPNLTFDERNVAHITWRDYRDAVQRPVVYYAKCKVGETVTPRNVDLSTTVAEDADYPSVAVSRDGKIVTVIHESSNGVRISESRDSGSTFESRVTDGLVKRNASCYVARLLRGGSLAIWTSERDERFDVATTGGTVSSVETLHSPRMYVESWTEIPSSAVYTAVDVTGRRVQMEDHEGDRRRIRPLLPGLVFVTVGSSFQQSTIVMMRSE